MSKESVFISFLNSINGKINFKSTHKKEKNKIQNINHKDEQKWCWNAASDELRAQIANSLETWNIHFEL